MLRRSNGGHFATSYMRVRLPVFSCTSATMNAHICFLAALILTAYSAPVVLNFQVTHEGFHGCIVNVQESPAIPVIVVTSVLKALLILFRIPPRSIDIPILWLVCRWNLKGKTVFLKTSKLDRKSMRTFWCIAAVNWMSNYG
jgi:hypothetical protein